MEAPLDSAAEAGRPKVLVVEDDEALRRAVVTRLTAEGYEVAGAATADEARDGFDRLGPDLVIVDVRLPAGNEGLEFARAVRQQAETPLVFLTGAHGVTERLAAFEVGADDYLTKPFSMAELVARVRAILRRTHRFLSGRLFVRDLELDLDAERAWRAGAPVPLTATEFRLLAALARAPGRVVSKVQLLSEVWEVQSADANLVEVHMSALRRKLEALGPRMIFTERARGYVLRP